MAGMNGLASRQLAAILQIRWQMLVNKLRTRRGRGEAVSSILLGLFVCLFGIGPAVGFGYGAYAAVQNANPGLLSLLFWAVLLYWQFFPAMAVTASDAPDSSTLLRFPIRFSTFSFVWLLYGSLDSDLLIAGLWLFGILIGATIASPASFGWMALVLFLFATLNLLLSRLLAAWLERWLAKRRTRELLGILSLLAVLGIQVLPRLLLKTLPNDRLASLWHHVVNLQWMLPPGVTARVFFTGLGQHAGGSEAISVLGLYLLVFAIMLAVRLHAQYLGENLSEAAHRKQVEKPTAMFWSGLERIGVPDAVVAVFEKEMAVLFRSGRQILTILIMPLFLLVIFGSLGTSDFFERAPYTGFPAATGYGLLLLSRLIYNSLGAEREGVQFLFVAPVRFRQVMLGKNLAHMTVFAIQCALVFACVTVTLAPPSTSDMALSIAALLFAALVNFTAGNLFSLKYPKKLDSRRSGQLKASAASGLAIFASQLAIALITAPLFLLVRRNTAPWTGVLVFLVLATFAFAGYLMSLGQVDRLALERREDLLSELCRAA